MNRREFLAGPALLAQTLVPSLGQGGTGDPTPDGSPDGYEPPEWLRYARAVMVDGYSPPLFPHMADFEAARLLARVTHLGGNLLRFQPIGYWAYYPSEAYPPHPELARRDLIDEVSRECRRAGVHLYCYTGYGHPFMQVGYVDTHPKYAAWVRRDPEGKPWGKMTHLGWPPRQPICVLSDAYRAAIRTVVRELCDHDIDGVYFDGPWRYLCFCESCRRNYKNFAGFDLDRLRSAEDSEAQAAWDRWFAHCNREDAQEFRRIIHGSGKFMAGGGSHRIADGFMCEAIPQVHARLAYGLNAASLTRPYKKVSLMYMGFYNVSDYDQPPHQGAGLVVHNTNLEDGDEMRMWGLVNVASGGAPIYATANRLYYGIGSGTTEPAREVFDLMRRYEPVLKDSVPVPYITIVTAADSPRLGPSRAQSWNWDMSQAFALAMLDLRIGFDICPISELTPERLAREHALALCGVSAISAAAAARLADWVRAGGALLATWDTGLYDETGALLRNGGALSEILGVRMTGEPLAGVPECYYRVRQAHAALSGFGEGAVIMGDNRLVPVALAESASLLADCWNLGTNEVRGPAIATHQYGQGRTIYVSGSLEANYFASRVVSIRRVLSSTVRHLGGDAPLPFRLSAPAGVYGILRQAVNGDLALWLLAPVGFKDASGGLMRQDYVRLTDIQVQIRVPSGRQVRAVYLARAGRALPFTLEGNYVAATLPALHIAELVHLDLT